MYEFRRSAKLHAHWEEDLIGKLGIGELPPARSRTWCALKKKCEKEDKCAFRAYVN